MTSPLANFILGCVATRAAFHSRVCQRAITRGERNGGIATRTASHSSVCQEHRLHGRGKTGTEGTVRIGEAGGATQARVKHKKQRAVGSHHQPDTQEVSHRTAQGIRDCHKQVYKDSKLRPDGLRDCQSESTKPAKKIGHINITTCRVKPSALQVSAESETTRGKNDESNRHLIDKQGHTARLKYNAHKGPNDAQGRLPWQVYCRPKRTPKRRQQEHPRSKQR